MSDELNLNDLDPNIQGSVYTQDYTKKPTIEGVKIIPLAPHVAESGDFSEILRLNGGEVEQIPGFSLAQINRTKLIPGCVKAWHFHYKQDELWYVVPGGHLFVGLWDIRGNSSSSGVSARIILGEGKSQLLFIPKGVAHGLANFSQKSTELFYFINQKFDPSDPDEQRLKWDSLGADFWTPEKD